jgi:pimeloyl-ACP methyl ester carboxylesterase
MAADAAALLTALEVEAAHVVGISMGGMVAQELALSTPERVHTLTLGCTFPGGPEARMTDPAVVGQLADAILSGDAERALRVGYEVMIAPHYAEDPANYALYVEVAGLYRAPLQVLIAQLQAISGHDTSERLSEISVPTLVVHGTADRLLESVNGELVARLIPNSRLELLDGAGHMFFWEQPERAAALVREHASGVTAP